MIESKIKIGLLQRCCLLVNTLLLVSWFSQSLLGTEPEVTTRKKVSEGLEHYSAGRFSEAAQAFEQAAEHSRENSPESVVVLFDQACALRAAGDSGKARELFLQVAISDNKKLASDAHHNLAAIAADEGRQSFGEDPLAANAEQRETALERLRAAVSHYRDSLRRNSENQDSRHNMELLRRFIKHLEDGWNERDLQQMREKKDLFQFLVYLDQQQSQLRDHARELESRGSRLSRLERTKLAESQQKLLDEIGPLKAKIDALLTPQGTSNTPPANPTGGALQQSQPSAEEQAVLQQLKQMIGEVTGRAEQSIAAAAKSIQAGEMAGAMQQQQATCDRLYQTYTLLAPLQQVLQRAIDDQQTLIERPKQPNDQQPNELDFATLAWRQDWITNLSHALSPKAAAMLQAMPTEPEVGQLKLDQELKSAAEPTTDAANVEQAQESPEKPAGTEPSAIDPTGLKKNPVHDLPSTNETTLQQMENSNAEMLQALRRALERAIELSPEIVEHSKSANQGLLQRQPEVAEPQQQEVLRLLKEIADLLPKQPPQDQQDTQPDQKQQDQSQQNQDDKQSQDQQRQDKDQQSQKSNEQHQDSSSKDQQQSDSNKSSQPESSPEQRKAEEKQEQQTQADKDKQKSDQEKQEQARGNESKNASQPASEAQAQQEAAKQNAQQQQLAEERAQVILRRIREREAKYRELLQQLRQAQGKRAPVDKDW